MMTPEVNGSVALSGHNGHPTQQHEDKEANLEDESPVEDSEYRNNDEEDEGDELEASSLSPESTDQVNPSKPLTKHPLQHRWTLWYDNPGKKTTSNSWADFLQKVTSFDTVEDFWRVYNNIKPASTLASGSNYHLFKDNIEPKWEDAHNSKGGRWTFQIPVKTRSTMDQMWLYAVLACIGETFECTEDICGIVISARKVQDRLCLWTKDSRSEQNVMQIGRHLKQVLEIAENVKLGYQSHEESAKRSSRNKFEV